VILRDAYLEGAVAELAACGVLSVSPGLVMTEMGKMEGEAGEQVAAGSALGRAAQPIELARVMAFLASPDASYMTGVDVLVDGGTVAAMQCA
jgi:NAD(P)-dependent dehydrogenase (short-subunit alcohol dehydrogenase family)